MDLTIYPYLGVGSIRFGMTVDQVRTAVGMEPQPFKKTELSVFPTDAFRSLGVHVYYKESGVCKAIEMGYPASPTLNGEKMIGRPFEDLAQWFQERDDSITRDDSGLRSMKMGVSLYAPSAEDDPSEPVKGIMAFARDYWD